MKNFLTIIFAIFFCNLLQAFTPLSFVKNTNIYEVNVRQYTPEGTFNAFAKHLPRLKKMGVKTIWFMPVQPIGIKNRKGTLGSYYSCKNYTAINPEYGTLQDFKNTVNFAHQLGIKVMIDWVANHTAWDNAWVTEHPEYYTKDSAGKMYSPFDWADVVQVNTKSEALCNAHINAMQYWVKTCNIDGFRCDVADFLPIEFWIKIRKAVDKIKPQMWLAECSNPKYFEAFDILYGWEWLHKMEDLYKGKTTMASADSILKMYYTDYTNNKFRILFTSNHDENSWSGSEFERLGTSSKTFATLCANLPGIPLVYSGQEASLNKRLRFFDKDTINFTNCNLESFYAKLLLGRKNFKEFKNVLPTFLENKQNVFALISLTKTNIVNTYNLNNEPKILQANKNGITLPINIINIDAKGGQSITIEPWQIANTKFIQ